MHDWTATDVTVGSKPADLTMTDTQRAVFLYVADQINVFNSDVDKLGTGESESAFVEIRVATLSMTHTVFEVVDSGEGIKATNPDDVFQPFLSTKREGMGMGLPLCKSLVESHGGRIWVASTAGTGTSICFTLLRSDQPAAKGGRIQYSGPE